MNYYTVLGLKRNASQREIKNAFWDRAKLYHPDVTQENQAHQKFVLINEAYEILSDRQKRYIYDRIGVTGTKTNNRNYDEWIQKARERAADQSRMGYEAFMQSPFYKKASLIANMVSMTVMCAGVFIGVLPVVWYYMMNEPENLYSLIFSIPIGFLFVASGMIGLETK